MPDLDDESIIPFPAMAVYQPIDQKDGTVAFLSALNDPYSLVPLSTRTTGRAHSRTFELKF